MENSNIMNAEENIQNVMDNAVAGIDKATVIKYALIGSAVVVGTILVSKWLFAEDKSAKIAKKTYNEFSPKVSKFIKNAKHEEESILDSPIAKTIKATLSSFLINIAKQKIVDYLSQPKIKNAKEALQPTS